MLSCKHCRAAAQPMAYPDELTTAECRRLIENIASFAKPIIILTGGEPMLRPDIYDIAAYAAGMGLPVVMAPCGMLIDDQTAAQIVRSGIRRISISIDGATARTHDAFRGVNGTFHAAMRGLHAAKAAGLDFQINTTVTKHNLAELPAIRQLAIDLGASVFNPFLLVPTGRGKALADQVLSAQQYEDVLHWLAELHDRPEIKMRVTCAPHYQRILHQRSQGGPKERPAKGCMGGQSFAFISHRGKVQICGFLDVECGDLRKEDMNFRKVWDTSPVFLQMRDINRYHGRCGYCQFRKVCGGCRARAFAFTGDYLGEEPFCL
ncbi:MAG: radical SAM protein, partial [Planctomycetes bacterium]|nr:radical SAM protein [Planctomycetota bacterium]